MTIATIKTDSQIKTDVLNELKWDPTVDETEVGVQVKNGIVTLTGGVSSYPKRLAAIDAAHRVYGVLDVVDELKIRIPPAWGRTDQEIAAAVRNALKWDILVPDELIISTVSGGIVTLKGEVPTWTQRSDTEHAVRRLTGVTGVVNQITVAARAIDPIHIKRQIEDALERQTEREAKRIGVTVREGVVTLTGTLRSWGEKNAIERAALYTRGVKRIDDLTVVDPYQ
jgi:osmotically-inducible protein OsmY